jgi:hypothetical protein
LMGLSHSENSACLWQNEEPTSGLEPLTCSLRVRSHAFTAVSRGFRKRLRKSYLPVLRF